MGRKARRHMLATRYYTQCCASAVDVPGLSVPGQKLADCSVLSANPGAGIPLWTSPRRRAPSAQCTCSISRGNFNFEGEASVGHPILLEKNAQETPPLTWDVQVTPYKSFRKVRIAVLWRQRHVHWLCQKNKLFFFFKDRSTLQLLLWLERKYSLQ